MEGLYLTRFYLFIFNTASCPTHLLLDTVKARSKMLQTFPQLEEEMLTLWTLESHTAGHRSCPFKPLYFSYLILKLALEKSKAAVGQ